MARERPTRQRAHPRGDLQIGHRLTFAMPADYARHTGGWVYDQRIVAELEELGWAVDRLTLPAGFPSPDVRARVESTRLIADIPAHSILLADQLALGVLPEIVEREGARLRLVAVVHHPLALEERLSLAERERLFTSERRALQHVALAIVPSSATADALTSDYAMPAERILLAPPGADPQPLSRGSGERTLRLLSIGSVVPRKDHGALIEALAGLTNLPWRLTIAGSTELAPEHAKRIRKAISDRDLGHRIVLTGALGAAELEPLWQSADLYVAASRHEGYGMAIAEAISRGVPVISTDAGAVGQWLDRRAALVVPVGDDRGLREAISLAMGDIGLRERLRAGAIAAREQLPSWPASASRVDQRLSALFSIQPRSGS